MSGDRRTLEFYDARAADYAAMTIEPELLAALDRFAATLPAAGAALDLGCGPGWASAVLAERGFAVDPTDGAPGMVAEARRLTGLEARVMRFDELAAVAAYDGVWASFSLLHAPRAEIPALLARVRRALKPGGALFVGVKAAADGPSVERRDRLGRFYTDYAGEELDALLRDAGFALDWSGEGGGVGMEGNWARHLYRLARRGA